MTERIFISYRRDDSAGHAGRVFDRLKADFGQDVLFMDVDTIPLGANFVRVLRDEVAKCRALLAIIGPNWLNVKDEDGMQRLDNPSDFVRVEIAAALQRDIPVIPILLEGARIPKAHALPDDLKELSERNGLDVRHASFHADMDKLVKGLRTTSKTVAAATKIGTRLESPRPLIPSARDAIAAAGEWTVKFKIDPHAAVAPPVFTHLYIRTHVNEHFGNISGGAIVTGEKWDRSRAPLWRVVHGWVDDPLRFGDIGFVTYLGPVWQPEYARLSDEVFEKVGAKPLTHFVKHP